MGGVTVDRAIIQCKQPFFCGTRLWGQLLRVQGFLYVRYGGDIFKNLSIGSCVRRQTIRVTGCVVSAGTAIHRTTGGFKVDGDAMRVRMAG